MAEFRKDNGKAGIEHAYHTATGYACVAKHPANLNGIEERVIFFVRHVVGDDGRPYTEIGFSGLEPGEHGTLMEKTVEALKFAGLHDVPSLAEARNGALAFSQQATYDPSMIAIRLNAGKDGISLAVDALSELIEDSSKAFVKEQEQVDNVLFKSILHSLGPELAKGPGGEQHAVEKAHELAEEFEQGWTN